VFQVMTLGLSFVHTVPLSSSSAIWCRPHGGHARWGREGNRGPGGQYCSRHQDLCMTYLTHRTICLQTSKDLASVQRTCS